MSRFFFPALLGIALAGSPAVLAADTRVPVLLELFTSEGCSDCPPADRLLETLDRTQPVPGAELIVLSEHVDYWNRLGWTDPWSSAANSARQQEYARTFHTTDVYTPQLVVDGAAEMVGSDAARISAETRKAARQLKIPIALTVNRSGGSTVRLHVDAGPGSGTVFAAIADDKDKSEVKRGENAGRALTHIAVLRELRPIGALTPGKAFAADAELPASRGAVRVVVFVQNRGAGRILGIAEQRVAGSD